MVEANIFDDDLLVIERIGDYSHGHIVLAFVDGQRLVRRLERRERFDDALKSLADKGIVTLYQCDQECLDKSSERERSAMLVIDGASFFTVERKAK